MRTVIVVFAFCVLAAVKAGAQPAAPPAEADAGLRPGFAASAASAYDCALSNDFSCANRELEDLAAPRSASEAALLESLASHVGFMEKSALTTGDRVPAATQQRPLTPAHFVAMLKIRSLLFWEQTGWEGMLEDAQRLLEQSGPVTPVRQYALMAKSMALIGTGDMPGALAEVRDWRSTIEMPGPDEEMLYAKLLVSSGDFAAAIRPALRAMELQSQRGYAIPRDWSETVAAAAFGDSGCVRGYTSVEQFMQIWNVRPGRYSQVLDCRSSVVIADAR